MTAAMKTLIFLVSVVGLISAEESHNETSECPHHSGIHLASWNYCGVGQYGKYIFNDLILSSVLNYHVFKFHFSFDDHRFNGLRPGKSWIS